MSYIDLLFTAKGTAYEKGAASRKSDPRKSFTASVRNQLALFRGDVVDAKPTFTKAPDGKVYFELRYGNRPIDIAGDGETKKGVDEAKFEVVLTSIIEAVEEGKFDEQLNSIASDFAKRFAKQPS